MNEIEVDGTKYPVEISFDEKKTSSASMRDGKIVLRILLYLMKPQETDISNH